MRPAHIPGGATAKCVRSPRRNSTSRPRAKGGVTARSRSDAASAARSTAVGNQTTRQWPRPLWRPWLRQPSLQVLVSALEVVVRDLLPPSVCLNFKRQIGTTNVVPQRKPFPRSAMLEGMSLAALRQLRTGLSPSGAVPGDRPRGERRPSAFLWLRGHGARSRRRRNRRLSAGNLRGR